MSASDLSDWDASSDEEYQPPASLPAGKPMPAAPVKQQEPSAPAPTKVSAKKAAPSVETIERVIEAPVAQKGKGKKEAPAAPAAAQKKGGKKGKGAVETAEEDVLRCPILCIMGHVDTGKTSLLDKIRRTNVQGKEAGGITQQIGATFFPKDSLLKETRKLDPTIDLKVPGLLIIDTPGHASFTNLRQRGSSLCDMAIVVVDIMHGVEPQTKESIQLLKKRKCPFVIALNKVDRIQGWAVADWEPSQKACKKLKGNSKDHFESRAQQCLLELTSDVGLNFELYWKNRDPKGTFSVIPTSAHTGQGIPDLLFVIVKMCQNMMHQRITLNTVDTQATVLEVKDEQGLGSTIDVILTSGALHEGDEIVVCGMNGPIVTHVKALVTPQPLKEMRVKGIYTHHKRVTAAMGVKIAGQGLENAIAGTSIVVVPRNKRVPKAHLAIKDIEESNPDHFDIVPLTSDEIDELREDAMEEVQQEVSSIFDTIDRTSDGVYVMASTLGSLEALLDFLSESNIPVNGIALGTVNKLDVLKASTMRERGRPEYSVILAFDVKVSNDALKEADKMDVTIYTAEIIYHLFDQFTKHMSDFKEEQRREKAGEAIFPVLATIMPDAIFNKRDPLIFGVRIDDGELRVGTPLLIPDRDMVKIGKVDSMELERDRPVDVATKGMSVCVKVVGEPNIQFGRQIEGGDRIVSAITRKSIDVMKTHFKDDLKKHLKLVVHLKKVLGIV